MTLQECPLHLKSFPIQRIIRIHPCNIFPSYQVKPGDVVAVREKSRSSVKFKTLLEENSKSVCPKWIEKAKDSFEGKIVAMPARDDIDYEVAEHLIVELYSK